MALELQQYHVTRVRYFGPLIEHTSTHEEELELSLPCTVAQLRALLEQRHTGLVGAEFRIAVDAVMQEPDTTISAAGELSCLPAFAGG